MGNNEQNELTGLVRAFPNRIGEKPKTTGPAPHQQRSQYPETEKYADALHDYVTSFEGVENGVSHIGDGGLRAYFIAGSASSGFSERFLVDNEFAHIHRHGSHSLHLVLPPDIGEITDKKGWTEGHPLAVAGRIPRTNHLLFGARNQSELEVAQVLMRISYLYASQQWTT